MLSLHWHTCDGELKLLIFLNFEVLILIIFLRCGSTQSVFYLEVGRFTSTGAGEIWMETFDPMIAENMNTVILK